MFCICLLLDCNLLFWIYVCGFVAYSLFFVSIVLGIFRFVFPHVHDPLFLSSASFGFLVPHFLYLLLLFLFQIFVLMLFLMSSFAARCSLPNIISVFCFPFVLSCCTNNYVPCVPSFCLLCRTVYVLEFLSGIPLCSLL